MSYPTSYCQFLNLPKPPLDLINFNLGEYQPKIVGDKGYVWTDDQNSKINSWAQQNICSTVYFAFQMFRADSKLHKDAGGKAKLLYLLDDGGFNVLTSWYDEDLTTCLQTVKIPKHTWALLKTDVHHQVVGIEPGRTRWAICSQIFQ